MTSKRWIFNRCTSVVLAFCVLLSCVTLSGLLTLAAEISGYEDESVVRFINAGTKKLLTVHGGTDANNTNVCQYSGDGSAKQKFKIKYNLEDDCYMIAAMCSSDGNNRVLDIVKDGGTVNAGCNVQIYQPVDPVAQQWQFYYYGNNRFLIVPIENPNLALTSYGTSNGTANGRTPTSAGNVYLSQLPDSINMQSISNNQLWVITEVTPHSTIEDGYYSMRNKLSNKYVEMSEDDFSVSQRTDDLTLNQIWQVNYIFNGYYVIRPITELSRGLVVDGDYAAMGSLITTDNVGTNDMVLTSGDALWKIIPNVDGQYRVVPKTSLNSQVMTVLNGSTSNGATLVQVEYTGGNSQRWYFEDAVCPSEGYANSSSFSEHHFLEYITDTNTPYFKCPICGSSFECPEMQDPEILSEADMLSVFALQRMLLLQDCKGYAPMSVEACVRAMDKIRERYYGYDCCTVNGLYKSPYEYAYNSTTNNVNIEIASIKYDAEYIIGGATLWNINQVLPFPADVIGEAAKDTLAFLADGSLGSYLLAGFEFGAEYELDKITEKLMEKNKNLYKSIKFVGFAISVIDTIQETSIMPGHAHIQISLYDNTCFDTFVGYYYMDNLGTIHVRDERFDFMERNASGVVRNEFTHTYSRFPENQNHLSYLY